MTVSTMRIRARDVRVGDQLPTVTVTFCRGRYYEEFSKLPGRTYGPFGFAEVIRDLRIAALLEPADARSRDQRPS